MKTPDRIHCPKCGSTQLSINTKESIDKKSIVNAMPSDGAEISAGTTTHYRAIITCITCGKKFNPDEGHQEIVKQQDTAKVTFKQVQTQPETKKAGIVILCLCGPLSAVCFYNQWNIAGCIMFLLVLIGAIISAGNPFPKSLEEA
jgi:hypothetical protein